MLKENIMRKLVNIPKIGDGPAPLHTRLSFQIQACAILNLDVPLS